MKKTYSLHQPEEFIPLVFDSPHSGTDYPEDFNYACDFASLEKAEDKYVDDLFSEAPKHGAPLLCANFPRSYLDVNRAIDDIDEELLSKPWDIEGNLQPNPSNRSYAGIGLIRRLVQPGEALYDAPLTPKEVKDRIDKYYVPYHTELEKLIENAHYHYGQVWHINCHSMPSSGTKQGALGHVNPFSAPDFVLGDRDGTSCDIGFTHALRNFLTGQGYKVAINDPYKGVELVERYSAPSTGRHSIQIEICRSLYLNEETYEKNKRYDTLKGHITELIAFCAEYSKNNLIPIAAD